MTDARCERIEQARASGSSAGGREQNRGNIRAWSALPKFFGIGLGKTGTTSLHETLRILGWQSIHNPPTEIVKRLLAGDPGWYNAFSDKPIQRYFRELDAMLVLKLGDGWEPLCRYLGVPVPARPYPWANKSPVVGARASTSA